MSGKVCVNFKPRQVQVKPSGLENIRIRVLVKSDLPALEWGGEFTHFRRLYQQIYRSMLFGEAKMWVVELPGPGVIGQMFVQLNCARKELADGNTLAYLYGFRIRPRWRDIGIGSIFLKTVETDLRERRRKWITLNVNRKNQAAKRFYERHSYEVVAMESGQWSYLDHNGDRRYVSEPAWRMRKTLIEV
jgi:ribosomal protein S18 acetylase RimI-like enzyme